MNRTSGRRALKVALDHDLHQRRLTPSDRSPFGPARKRRLVVHPFLRAVLPPWIDYWVAGACSVCFSLPADGYPSTISRYPSSEKFGIPRARERETMPFSACIGIFDQ